MINDVQNPDSIIIQAPAKLNLYLYVTGQREDGYHELNSLVAFASICDSIQVRPAPELMLTASGPFADRLKLDEENLVWRAARALQNVAKTAEGAELSLTKNMPVASGIGGGSANAAATIRALIRLWSLKHIGHELPAVALSLGADVPVCLYGRPALMSGVGELIKPAPKIPPAHLVIVNPGDAVSTKAVFKTREGPYSSPPEELKEAKSLQEFTLQLASRCNDLTAPALVISPVIQEVLTALETTKNCLFARMSGSGATCYGIFETRRQAKVAASRISLMHPDWWIKTANFLD